MDPGLGQPPQTRESPAAARPKGMATGRRQGLLRQTLRGRPGRSQPARSEKQGAGSGPGLRRPAGPGYRFQDPVPRVRASRFWLRRARL